MIPSTRDTGTMFYETLYGEMNLIARGNTGVNMFEKLEEYLKRKQELESLISDPQIIADAARYQGYTKEYSQVAQIVELYLGYRKIKQDISEHHEMQKQSQDQEFLDLVSAELVDLEEKQNKAEEELKLLLIPKDPLDDRNIIVEIRAGTGGDEAALFAANLYRMYIHYAELNDWKVETMDTNPTGIGGFKEIIFSVIGKYVYRKLRYESGVHRVQRVPATEGSGRIHTSAATVMVLPEAEDVEVTINIKDLRIDTYRAGGCGGQHVNVTDSAVRITHLPTGVVVQCQDERSQLKNKNKAMRVLRARLREKFEQEQMQERSEQRRSQVKTGDRSEKIRTYNYPQNRVTEHRIGLAVHNLQGILDGNLDLIINPLITADYEDKLSQYGIGSKS